MAQPLGSFGAGAFGANRRPPIVPVARAQQPDAPVDDQQTFPVDDQQTFSADGQQTFSTDGRTSPTGAADPATDRADDDAGVGAESTPDRDASDDSDASNDSDAATDETSKPVDRSADTDSGDASEKPARRGRGRSPAGRKNTRAKSKTVEATKTLVVIDGGEVRYISAELVVINLDSARDADDPAEVLATMRQLREVPDEQFRKDTVSALQDIIEEKVLLD